jgi:hypothetical protein
MESTIDHSILDLIPLEQQPEKVVDSIYSEGERQTLRPHKKDYIIQTTRSGRKQIFRSRILPDIFQYWREIGNIPKSSKESAARIKVIINHLRSI